MNRTRSFGLRVIKLVEALPGGKVPDVIGRQVLRAGASVGANYRAACRARSRSDFEYKLGIVEEEADECLYRMELLVESDIVKANLLASLRSECEEVPSIIVSSIRTARVAKAKKSAFRNPKSEIL
jgi:four helix bundle protein